MKLNILLKALRIHTSCLTQAGVMLGAIIGGVREPIFLVLCAMFGLIYHAWGFLDNNIQDLPYDKKDPAKKHFPLVTGEISIKFAELLSLLLLLFTILSGLYLSNGSAIAFTILILAIASALLYNRTCKRSLFASIYITIAFSALPLISYFAVATNLSLVMLGFLVYTVFLMQFQISVEGYLKDLGTDPVNLLRFLGARVEKGVLETTFAVELYSYGLKFLGLLTGVYLWFIASFIEFIPAFLMMLLGYGILVMVEELLSQDYDNEKITKYASLIEVFTYFFLILSLQGILGWLGVAFFIMYPLCWFIVLNKITWGTWLRPKV